MEFKSLRAKFDNDMATELNVKHVAGTDEAGRGPLAGPIVVASCVLPLNYDNYQINDSKKLSEKKREVLFDEIINKAISYSIKVYDNHFVEKFNPKQTSRIGMIETLKELSISPELILVDGEEIEYKHIKCIKLIKGDAKSQVIGAASILAKVTRDRIMSGYAQEYPLYGFDKHKGYGTKQHIAAIYEYGILPIHRATYEPIKSLLNKKGE